MVSPDSTRMPLSSAVVSTTALPDPGDDDDAAFRHESLRWIHQALTDLDCAIEAGRSDTARELLHRIQDVLQADER
jgi:hypothetical protein